MRSKIALASLATSLNGGPVRRVWFPNTLSGKDTVVIPVRSVVQQIEKIEAQYEHVDYFEIVAVSPEMCPATALEIVDDDYADLDCCGPKLEPRSSAELAGSLSEICGLEQPSFGRRMLLVNFEQHVPPKGLDKAKERVVRSLGSCRPVWQGRTFCGYCFVDNRKPDQILEPLYKTLDCDEIEDYLLVQLVNMILADKSGLSPLSDWMTEGFRGRPPRFDSRSGRRRVRRA